MKPRSVVMVFYKSTENTYVYKQVMDPESPPIFTGGLYIQKWAIGQKIPKWLKITMEPTSEPEFAAEEE